MARVPTPAVAPVAALAGARAEGARAWAPAQMQTGYPHPTAETERPVPPHLWIRAPKMWMCENGKSAAAHPESGPVEAEAEKG